MLNGKAALVTGAGSGIGLGIARALAEHGADVILAGHSESVFEAARRLSENGLSAEGLLLDITDAPGVTAAVRKVREEHGRLDILVNNAGMAKLSRFAATADELRDRHIDVNLKGTWNMTKAALPLMLEQKQGRIINISSVTGRYVSDPGYAAYAMTKAGIIGLTKALAVELAACGITVNAICPGFILTPNVLRNAAVTCPESPSSVLEGIAAGVPVGRLGTPEDVGELAAFLADDKASYLTGGEFVVDGGNLLPETNVMGLKSRA